MVEFLKLEYYKRWSEKVLVRLNESKWTKLFMLTSILQAIAIIILELRVYTRNNSTGQSLSTIGSISDEMTANASCIYQPSYVRLNNIKDENLIFIFFQIFQVWFCFSAMYNQNSMQVIAIVVINFLFALNGIIQWVEVKKWFTDFDLDCPGRLPLHTQFVKYDLPLIIALFLFSIAMGFLCWKLYRQYGWNIYKKIGADVEMQTTYRTYLIYLLLLKLDAMFILGLSIEALNVYVYTIGKLSDLKHLRYMPIEFYIFHLFVTICVGINQILAYYS
ncbi:4381_t:CDS:2, partial [Dentiscutata heterogama]